MTKTTPMTVEQTADLLADIQQRLWAGKVAILTGAGISAESGVATYRDHDTRDLAATPLWDRVDPREMATLRAFRKNRNKVNRWYMRRVREMRAAQPNAAHHIIQALAACNPELTVYTQNVDGLHERTGTDARRLHGSVQHYRCRCGHKGAVPALETMTTPWPYCESCGSSRTRPDVVWFGEALPEDVLDDAITDFYNADLKLVVGTSAVVRPVSGLPLLGHGLVVEINPEETAITPYCDLRIRGIASAGLNRLIRD